MILERHLLQLGHLAMAAASFVGPSLAADAYNYKVKHVNGSVEHHGLLRIEGTSVNYFELDYDGDDFHFVCRQVLAKISLKRERDATWVVLPVGWRNPTLRSDDTEVSTENLYALIQMACKTPVSRHFLDGGVVRYRVAKGSVIGELTVEDTRVAYRDKDPRSTSFDLSCHDFHIRTTIRTDSLDVSGVQKIGVAPGLPAVLRPADTGFSAASLFKGVHDACITQQEAVSLRVKRDAEDAARRWGEAAAWRQALATELAADAKHRENEFREGVLKVLRVADESDPFLSVRGEYDLTAADSHQWKTNLKLAGADKCILLKGSPVAPGWTYVCLFQSVGWSYESIVKSIQQLLNINYQPDETAVNINQVFFADPAKPRRRVFVARITDSTVGLSVVVLQPGNNTPDFSKALRPVFEAAVPKKSISDEVDTINSGPHQTAPNSMRAADGSGISGRTTMSIHNSTGYELSLFYDGPISAKIVLAPGAVKELDLAPGRFRVAGRVPSTTVLPFYGEETYFASTRYSVEYYIGPKE